MEVVKLSIRLGRDSFQYNSEVLRKNGKFYYRANGAIIKITPIEARCVIRNPRLYYFSIALKLHLLINKKLKS
jgi:hypothetical protein